MFRTRRVHLQEENFIYGYGMVRFTCVGERSPMDRRVSSS